ncbi:porin [Opitutales bacterium]|nr:porin [Opitutales bacterium]
MKNKLLSLASLLAVFNANAIEIGPTGSGVEFGGFIDIAGQKQGADSETTFVGQVEVNLDFSSGPVSASVDLDFTESQGLSDADGSGFIDSEDDTTGGNLEEAVVTYDFGNGLSVSAGKMLSYMGFEAYDPTNMYQYSYAYDVGGQNDTGAQMIYDAYDVGFSIDYGTDLFSIGLWSSMEADAGYELALAYTGIENFTAKAIYSDFSAPTSEAYEKSTYWVSYQLDKLLIAGEIAENDQLDTGEDVEGYLIMVNYAMTDAAALTLRYSGLEITGATNNTVAYEGTKFTISPSYVFNDNFSGLLEYSSYDSETVTLAYAEPEELIAVELIYTF